MRRIKWLFFDVGEVLMDERLTNRAFAEVAADVLGGEGLTVSVDHVMQAQRAAATGGVANPRRGALTMLGRDDDALFDQVMARSYPLLDEPFTDAHRGLERLSSAGYRLGVIANQRKAEAQARLEWSGLLDHMEVSLLSGDVGLKKPDPAIFQLALQMAGCTAADAAMVGDRLDNDIAPAKRLGMATVWVRRGLHEDYAPRSADEEADLTVRSLDELVEVLLGGTHA